MSNANLSAEAAARVAALYSDYGCYVGSSYERKIVQWMSDHGHPGYANELLVLVSSYDEHIGEAGRYWQHCPFTGETLAKINAEIKEVFQAATDRYEDWASD